jgi:hypothetical protein
MWIPGVSPLFSSPGVVPEPPECAGARPERLDPLIPAVPVSLVPFVPLGDLRTPCPPALPRPGSGSPLAGAGLDLLREILDLLERLVIRLDRTPDLALGVQDGGVVTPAEGLPDLGQ